MFKILVFLFIVIPAIEIALLIGSSQWIGIVPTFAIVVATGIIGAYLAKKQGLAAVREIRYRLERGQFPTDSLFDGACILIGGTLLLTPGYATDIFGFILLFPVTRKPVQYVTMKWIEKRMKENTIRF
ncbi:MAG: FxsA family protein [Ectobacillus sp.]